MPRQYAKNFPEVPIDEIDLNYAGEGAVRYTDEVSWLSDNNSFYDIVSANQEWTGDMDRISSWLSAQCRISAAGQFTFLQYEISVDGGRTYPFVITLDNEQDYVEFPLTGQLGRIRFKADAVWPANGRFQLVLMYRKWPASVSGANVNRTGNLLGSETKALNVRMVNDWHDDYILGKVQGRATGASAGYCDDIGSNFQSVHPITSGFTPLIDTNGIPTALIASSSVQDSAGGTGAFLYLLGIMSTDYTVTFTLVALNGTTPVAINIGKPIYRFTLGFIFAAGSAYNYNLASGNFANRGINYIGTGTFSTGSGFTTTYIRNRVDDGALVSPTYTCPAGKRALLWELKYAAEAANPVVYRTYGRSGPTAPWSLIIEDVVQGTIQPRRSLIGGWFSPGGEYTVVGKKKQGTQVLANFILSMIEVDESLFVSYIP